VGNISGLSQITTAATSLSNLILVSPQKTIGYQPTPINPVDGQPLQQPPALLFHYEGEQTVSLESDITDHYIEDNTALQDQISLRPEQITTHGFIGELNDVVPPLLAPIQVVADKLTTIGAYLPGLSETALLAYNEAFFLYQTAANAANSAVSAWNSITGVAGSGGESVIGSNGLTQQPNQTKQQQAFQQFYGYWRNRTLFTVQTPWAVFQNMAIKNLRAIQDAQTNVITDFEVTFKMIRIATTQTLSPIDPTSAQGRAALQAAGVTDLGVSTPAPGISLGAGLQTFTGLGQ
jgi:hypothetical protein